mgnify:CR=1 FL=1
MLDVFWIKAVVSCSLGSTLRLTQDLVNDAAVGAPGNFDPAEIVRRPNCCSKTRCNAFTPAPAESIRVPSMSKSRRRFEFAEFKLQTSNCDAHFSNRNLHFGKSTYRGRLAPSPTGYLHIGHAITFGGPRSVAGRRADRFSFGSKIWIERCRPEFSNAVVEDLRWFGLHWDEGPFFKTNAGHFISRLGRDCALRV